MAARRQNRGKVSRQRCRVCLPWPLPLPRHRYRYRYSYRCGCEAKTWHSFPFLLSSWPLSHCLSLRSPSRVARLGLALTVTCFELGRLRVSGSGFVVYSGVGGGNFTSPWQSFVSGDSIKNLLWTNFSIFQILFSVLSPLSPSLSLCVCVYSSFGWHQRTCLTFNRNQFILCEIIVLMAACSPLFAVFQAL